MSDNLNKVVEEILVNGYYLKDDKSSMGGLERSSHEK